MAGVEEQVETQGNGGAPERDGIAVENPATGEIIGHVPELSAEQVAELARRGRAAQVGWEAMGFEGRAKVMLRAQRWVMDNADRVIETIVSETGKTYEDAQLAEINYAGAAFGFWAKNAEEYLAEEKVRTASLFVKGRKLVLRYKPLGLIGVIGPWNYPLTR
jgi:acyl-CoA reductase-like NAD-dependent aldehyde dehydrogenase